MDAEKIINALIYSRYLFESLCYQIDETILNYAKKTRNNSTIKSFNYITKKTAEKVAIINAKVIVDEAIGNLNERYKKVATDKYIKGISSNEIALKEETNVKNARKLLERVRTKIKIKILKKIYSS